MGNEDLLLKNQYLRFRYIYIFGIAAKNGKQECHVRCSHCPLLAAIITASGQGPAAVAQQAGPSYLDLNLGCFVSDVHLEQR